MENKMVSYEMMHNALHEVIEGLQDDTMKINKAKEISNACGKIIAIGIGRLQYAIKQGAAMDVPELGITEDMLASLQIHGKGIETGKRKAFLLKK